MDKKSLCDRISEHFGLRDAEIKELRQWLNDERSANFNIIQARDEYKDKYEKKDAELKLCFENFSTANKELQAMKTELAEVKKESAAYKDELEGLEQLCQELDEKLAKMEEDKAKQPKRSNRGSGKSAK